MAKSAIELYWQEICSKHLPVHLGPLPLDSVNGGEMESGSGLAVMSIRNVFLPAAGWRPVESRLFGLDGAGRLVSHRLVLENAPVSAFPAGVPSWQAFWKRAFGRQVDRAAGLVSSPLPLSLRSQMSYLGLGAADETGVVEDRILLWAERMRSAGHMPDEKSMNRLRQVSITGMQATLTQHLLPRLDAEILDLFPHGVGVFPSDYQFYRGTADETAGRNRRQAAKAYPLLANDFPRGYAFRRAVDAGEPLQALIGRQIGLEKAVLRRISGVKPRIVDDGDRDIILRHAGALPPDWLPRTPEDWQIFADLAPALDSLLPPESKGNDGVGRLYQGSAGKWTDFAGRCRSAVALRDQPDGEVQAAQMRGIAAESRSMCRDFVLRLLVPVCGHIMLADRKPDWELDRASHDLPMGFLDEAQLNRLDGVAWSLLLHGKGAPAVLETIRTWVTGHPWPTGLVDVEESPPVELAGEWAPALTADAMAPNGVQILNLVTERDLVEEGRGLGHCVGGGFYAQRCRAGESFILALRDPTGRRLSTAEVSIDAARNCLMTRQHRGRRNEYPPTAAKAAFEWLEREIKAGTVVLNIDGHQRYMKAKGSLSSEIWRLVGYEWRVSDNLLAFLEAWQPLLPKPLRTRNMADWRKIADPGLAVLLPAASASFAAA